MIKIAKSDQNSIWLSLQGEEHMKTNPNWKKGFTILRKVSVFIILVAIDYEKKCITAEKVYTSQR